MPIRNHVAALAAAALSLSVATDASAALWSSTNTVAPISGMATMEISLTGDQLTVASDLEIAMPAGITNVTVTRLNGAGCAYVSATRVVRLIVDDPLLRPLPAFARPMCSIQYRVSRSTSAPFPMRGALCFTVEGMPVPAGTCVVDPGYLTVVR
ncbi:MAG TPA: hypothetical protein VFL14_03010 [Xanthomonadales bacterium]|nr:hypothetical protein [Xanthomonadales bacterium]